MDKIPILTGLSGNAPTQCERYAAGIEIVGPAGTGFNFDNPNLPVIAADSRGRGFLGIIGRDVLAQMRVVLDGPSQQVTLYL